MQLGELSPREIEDVVRSEVVARIGCHAGGRTYVVPVAYAYDGQAVYVHAFEGKKLQMMRQNPDVCVEIDHIDSPSDWKTVIAWGRFEELDGPAAERALELIMARCPPPSHEGVLFRIRLDERSGRFASAS